jgi:hypothetical protein
MEKLKARLLQLREGWQALGGMRVFVACMRSNGFLWAAWIFGLMEYGWNGASLVGLVALFVWMLTEMQLRFYKGALAAVSETLASVTNAAAASWQPGPLRVTQQMTDQQMRAYIARLN